VSWPLAAILIAGLVAFAVVWAAMCWSAVRFRTLEAAALENDKQRRYGADEWDRRLKAETEEMQRRVKEGRRAN
jgi:hypothetical protein